MKMSRTKSILLVSISLLLLPVGFIAVAGGLLGFWRVEREKRELQDFKLVRSISSPDGKRFALHFEHVFQQSAFPPEEIVLIDSHSNISIPELWLRMKANQIVLLVSRINQEQLALNWLSNSSLRLECSGCTDSSAEMLRRAPSASQISIEYVGFPPNAPYTNVELVEK
jgi:hypothetical protein